MNDLNIRWIQRSLADFDVRLSDLGSTMDYCNQNQIFRDTLVIQEQQPTGRGRGDKVFVSQKGGLYMSIIQKRTIELGLPLRAGLAVSYALGDYFIDNLIKWPNDIYCKDKKLSGILLVANHQKSLVNVGIGINVFNDLSGLENIAISTSELGLDVTREALAVSVAKAYKRVEKIPFDEVVCQCKKFSYDLIKGLAADIDSQGFLISLDGKKLINPMEPSLQNSKP